MAQVCCAPATTLIVSTASFDGTGVGIGIEMLASPGLTWPCALLPQHQRPPVAIAQVWSRPMATEVNVSVVVGGFLTRAGGRGMDCVPSPSCPCVFAPQQ